MGALTQKQKTLLASVVLVASQFVVFGPALKNEFLRYDDDTYVYENANIQSLKPENVAWMFARPYFRSYTPLTLLSHAIDYSVWKDNPWGHHLTSLILHGANTVLMFLFGIMILTVGRPKLAEPTKGELSVTLAAAGNATLVGAFVAAMLFSLHPTRVESVAWVSDRKDLLLALFLLPCFMAYIRYDAQRGTSHATRWYLFSLVCFVLALLSKSIAITAPIVMILLDALLLHKHDWRTNWVAITREKIPFFILSAAFGLFAMLSATASQMNHIVENLSSVQRWLLPFYSVAFYPAKILWPVNLTPIYNSAGTPLMLVAMIAPVGGTAFALILARKGKTAWMLSWLCYLVFIGPTITGLSAGIQPWADRYTYLPAISLMLFVGGGSSALWERMKGVQRKLLVALAGTLVFTLSYMSSKQIAIWKDSETLWRYATELEPDVPMTYANLGVALGSKGDHEGALKMYARAVRIQPNYADALYDIGITYETTNRIDSAVAYYSKAIAADPGYVDAYVNLGNISVQNGRIDDAIALYEAAVRIDDTDPDAYYNMGIAFSTKGDQAKALECFRTAIKFSPGYAKAYYNMGVIYSQQENHDAALACFVRAARLGMTDAQNVLSSRGYSW